MAHKYNEAVLLAASLMACSAMAQQSPAAPTGAAIQRVQPMQGARTTPAPATVLQPTPLRPCQSVEVDTPTQLTLGKSQVIRLPFPAVRMVVGGQGRAGVPQPVAADAAPSQQAQQRQSEWTGVAETDITLISPTELYFLGRRPGSMNVVIQAADGRCLVKDIVVTIDPATIEAKLLELLPQETGLRVRAAEHAIVLAGTVSDAVMLDQVLSIASAYGDGKRVVNLLRVGTPQQVMLEVKIAEVSKTLMDRFGLDFSRLSTSSSGSSIVSGIFGGAPGLLGRFRSDIPHTIIGSAAAVVDGANAAGSAYIGNPLTLGPNPLSKSATMLGIDAQKRDGIIRVLAEPNIMAISGQTASFLSGGKIFIPVAQERDSGGTTITLEEKEFGVGLKFTPTVLDGSRINLKLVSEASELQQSGSPFTSFNGVTAILPSMATRRVDTTVQLNDGQSFVVAGLIKNNMNGSLDKFPGLGEVPVMGALFRSNEFQTDQTELMFVVTPRLVKPLNAPVALPTDNHIVPTSTDVNLMGKAEGRALPPQVRVQAAPGTQLATPAGVQPVLHPLVRQGVEASAAAPAVPGDPVPAPGTEAATTQPVAPPRPLSTQPVGPVSALPANPFLP